MSARSLLHAVLLTLSAGFLAGLARGVDLKACARLGALAAAEIIQHLGARPEAPLASLARDNGLAV